MDLEKGMEFHLELVGFASKKTLSFVKIDLIIILLYEARRTMWVICDERKWQTNAWSIAVFKENSMSRVSVSAESQDVVSISAAEKKKCHRSIVNV